MYLKKFQKGVDNLRDTHYTMNVSDEDTKQKNLLQQVKAKGMKGRFGL